VITPCRLSRHSASRPMTETTATTTLASAKLPGRGTAAADTGRLLIKPAKKSVKSLLDRVRQIVKSNASATQAVVIQKLNPIIRGWATYHRRIVAKACFSSIDSQIWQLLWKWALRRHPTKGARWVQNRYFHAVGHRSWKFATEGPIGNNAHRLSSVHRKSSRSASFKGRPSPFQEFNIVLGTRRRESRSTDGNCLLYRLGVRRRPALRSASL
jgi:hypothetical protein